MPEGQEGRQRARVRVDLPIRVRQMGPPQESIEVTTTLDVSRNGVLFRTRQPYELHSTVWLIVPYNPTAAVQEAEFPATIIRIDHAADGSSEVAARFHSAHSDRAAVHVQSRNTMALPSERRSKERSKLSMPTRVRSEQGTEVAQTLDISRTGVLLRVTRTYAIGQQVWLTVPYKPDSPGEEIEARVVRVIERPAQYCVALHYTRTTGIRNA
jgi:hypothetical protein